MADVEMNEDSTSVTESQEDKNATTEQQSELESMNDDDKEPGEAMQNTDDLDVALDNSQNSTVNSKEQGKSKNEPGDGVEAISDEGKPQAENQESTDPYEYTKRGQFTSEIFKIELRNLPRFGFGVNILVRNYNEFDTCFRVQFELYSIAVGFSLHVNSKTCVTVHDITTLAFAIQLLIHFSASNYCYYKLHVQTVCTSFQMRLVTPDISAGQHSISIM